MGGNSEKGIGKYFAKFPEDRKKIFLVTKSHAWTLGELTKDLNNSLERMKTDYIDLFFVHSVSDISDIDDDTRLWAEKSKSEGKIRLFGFSTHSNMASFLFVGCVQARLDRWHYDDLQLPFDAYRSYEACGGCLR
jgi:predicted aldo/keto reductase-like oxidoreductase